MTDPTYNAESHHTPESRDRDARWVGHGPKGETMTADPKCEAGCISYYGGEKKHHRDCPYYPESLTKLNTDRIEALLAERDALRAAQSYTYIGKDGKPVLARDLEDERDALEADNQRLRDALIRIEDLTQHNMGMSAADETCVNREASAALKGDSHD